MCLRNQLSRFHQRTWALLRVKLRLSWRFVRICFFYTLHSTLLFFVFFFSFLRSPSNGLVDTFNRSIHGCNKNGWNVCLFLCSCLYDIVHTWLGLVSFWLPSMNTKDGPDSPGEMSPLTEKSSGGWWRCLVGRGKAPEASSTIRRWWHGSCQEWTLSTSVVYLYKYYWFNMF